ncbi:MAG: hypothetical protein WAW23_00360 [Candidatus Methanoperedens sp.]
MRVFAATSQGIPNARQRSCLWAGAYQFVPPSIPDKELAVAVQEVPRDEDTIFGLAVQRYEINKKSRLDEIRYAHDRWTLRMNLGRNFELQRECYRIPSYHYRSCNYLLDLPKAYVFLTEPHFETGRKLTGSKAEEYDARQKFLPSEQLVQLIEKSMVRPDDEDMIDLLGDLSDTAHGEEDEFENIRNFVTQQVEGFLTSCAKRKSRTKEVAQISRDGIFTHEASMELIDRLSLDLYGSLWVLQILHREFFAFLSKTEHIRAWGRVSVDNFVLRFDLDPKAFLLPEFPTLDDDRWLIT